MSEKCETCTFFVVDENSDDRCRRYPPQWSTGEDRYDSVTSYAMHPEVEKDGWCGEYKKKHDPYSYENAEAPVEEYLKGKTE